MFLVAALAAILVVTAACGGTAGPVSTARSAEPAPTLSSSVSLTPSPTIVATPTRPPTSPAPSAPAAVRPARELLFVEFTTGRRLSVQADRAARDVGQFAYSVPERGVYSGFAGGGLQVSAAEILLEHSGPATFIPLSVTGQDATPAPRGPTTVTIRIQARLDPVARTGVVTLTHDGTVIGMTASVPSVADLDPVAVTFERATVAGDAAALYGVMNSDITSAYTPTAFAQQWTSEQARVGTIGGMRRLSVGSPVLGDFGFWVVVMEYDVEKVAPTGARSSVRYDAFFVRQRAGWKVFYTAEK